MNSRPYTVHVYQGEAELISKWTLQYTDIETGGDIFGLWLNETEVVIQAVLGPGQNCRRTPTSFFQDEQYLSCVGGLLTNNEGLCNVGSWHSHHTMNLPEPSRGDKDTVWRHLPTLGRFLLLIATIERRSDGPKVSMSFNLFEATSKGNEVMPMKLEILEGQSPIRANTAVNSQMSTGAEVPSKKTPVKKESRARKPEVTGPEVNVPQRYRNPDVKANPRYNESSGLFRDQQIGRQGHRRSHNENITCDGVRSSVRLYNTFLRHGHSGVRPSRRRHVYRLETSHLSDGREVMVWYHCNHLVGKCDDCCDLVFKKERNGDIVAVHRQHDMGCCNIL